jgi:hypothetical protein
MRHSESEIKNKLNEKEYAKFRAETDQLMYYIKIKIDRYLKNAHGKKREIVSLYLDNVFHVLNFILCQLIHTISDNEFLFAEQFYDEIKSTLKYIISNDKKK